MNRAPFHAGAQLEVMVDSLVVAQLGSQALLPCTFTVVDAPISPEYLAVHWYFQDQELVSYDDSLNVSRPGASMDTEQLASGNASLVLRNVTVSDQGAYRCLVIHSPDRGEQSLHLAVLGQCWRGSGVTGAGTGSAAGPSGWGGPAGVPTLRAPEEPRWHLQRQQLSDLPDHGAGPGRHLILPGPARRSAAWHSADRLPAHVRR
uniref:Ig-like domain-containing protein n=1 Tax=Terrapene triunguis TaxID=2587831 RepID=A0A674IC16_9SAUR